MLARSSKLRHSLGAVIDLPRLVPAFSSKGFPFVRGIDAEPPSSAKANGKGRREVKPKRENKISEASLALEMLGSYIKDSMLVSAYDLHHRHLHRPERFFNEKEIIFVDSGGYELSPGFDQTEPVHWGTPRKKFALRDYLGVLAKLPVNLPFAISNFDWGSRKQPIQDQILAAQKLFHQFPNFMKDFIVKPGNHTHVDLDELVRHVKKLQGFDIIGLTEKELGRDLLQRLVTVAKLRLAMDREGIQVPIHIWGGLDPLLTPLYFFAGAEIFDGISWLRYAYIEGLAVYRDSYNLLVDGIENPTDRSHALALHQNLAFLRRQHTAFRDFVLHRATRFDMFGVRSSALERAYRALIAQVPEIDGGQ